MPLLQGQPFKLITPQESLLQATDFYTIGHTGERFQNKKDYEDRLALYSQSIWTCQCTGKGCLTHKEAWLSESSVKVSAKAAVATPLHKPLLMLVHHSLSPLDQLVEAASILCYSQFHVGEELIYSTDRIPVQVVKVKDAPRIISEVNGPSVNTIPGNGVSEDCQNAIVNGTANGILNPAESTQAPSNDGQCMQPGMEDGSSKKDMLPRLYTVLYMERNTVIQDVLPNKLLRVHRVPSKDQLRLFIRSCALRHRGSTCTPWMVAEELLQLHGIANKLPSLFLSTKAITPPQKRKKNLTNEALKKFKPDQTHSLKVNTQAAHDKANGGKMASRMFGQKCSMLSVKSLNNSSRPMQGINRTTISGNSSHSHGSLMPMQKINQLPGLKVPKKRGRPRLSAEEKERNKKLRQATLFNATGSMTGSPKFLKIKTKSTEDPAPEALTTISTQLPSGLSSPYKSPLKRATTSEALMKLPLMRRLVHEYKTIKGVMGQYRRMAYTMDLVLGKLTPEQVELIPDEALKNDLYLRQQKVENKKLLSNMTPEERKDYMKKKARDVALERWKERKMKNLKIEDKTLEDLKTLPSPVAVATPEGVDNCLFGDVVMITEFVKCYRELLLGEEKFKITSAQLMQALASNQDGYKVIADVMCCLLPAIIHDDTSRDCTHLGLSISAIPINYQTAPELARLCLKRQEFANLVFRDSDEYDQIGKEETELSDNLLAKLETKELWNLPPPEVIAVLKALVHKALGCSSLNAFMEETDEKLSIAFREKRLVLKKLAKERMEECQKKRADKKPKGDQPKRQRGRPKGYSPKIGGNIQEFYEKLRQQEEEAKRPMVDAVLQRRKSAEAVKKEKEALELLEKERQKQLEDDGKKRAVERKYEDLLTKRDNLLRRQPIGYDRDHNRYWIFHMSTPGLYVEKGWVDPNTNCQFIQEDHLHGQWKAVGAPCLNAEVKSESESKDMKPKMESMIHATKDVNLTAADNMRLLYENGCIPKDARIENLKSEEVSADSDEDRPLSIVTTEKFDEEDEKPLSIVKSKLNDDEDNKPLSSVKSKLTLSPMKMANRGGPPKEAYVLVDEDTQTFPRVEINSWHYYVSMDDIKVLIEALSDKGQRESQLLASININKDRLQYHYNTKPESLKLGHDDTAERVKRSLKEDIVQIERELIEGWLGGIVTFDAWEKNIKECQTVNSLGEPLIEAQKCMQLKFLKGLMAPIRKQLNADIPEAPPEYEDLEGPGVARWREAVLACTTYSRMHVLVGMFDSSIKWERSMATRKCKVCRSKQKDDPLLMCEKCENSYHTYCLRPPLKGDIPDSWLCPMCAPKKVRREKEEVEVEDQEDPDEKEDPTFSVTRSERHCKKKSRPAPKSDPVEKKTDQECCICWGRIGLIFCSKCSTPYHSECHEPPLQSRARKDWVCATCLGAKNGSNRIPVDRLEAPTMRRNVFGDMEQIIPKEKRVSNMCERSISGKFIKKLPQPANESLLEESKVASADEEILQPMERGRGARAKASSKAEATGSRRSGRNMNRKNYKYDSDEEARGDSDDEPDEEGDEKIVEKETTRRKPPSKTSVEVARSESESPDSDSGEASEDSDEEGDEKIVDKQTIRRKPPPKTSVEVALSESESPDSDSGEASDYPEKEEEEEQIDNTMERTYEDANATYNDAEETIASDDEVESDENDSSEEGSGDEKSSDNWPDGSSDDQLEISQQMSEEES